MKPLKPFILTSFAIVAMTTTAITTGALAQKGTTLTPSTKWSVLDVYDDKKPENSYCAVAKRFKPSTVMTLAKNKKNEASLALDFQSDRFNPGESLQVTLDPGAGQQRSYEVNPASKQAIVVRFGQDDTFFNALAKTGYLRAEVGSESINFDLADIDSGQDELGNCLANLNKPAAIANGGAYGVEGGAASGGADIDVLKNRVDYLSKENERLSQLAAQAEKAQGSNAASDDSLKVKEAMVQELVQSVDALKSENAELQQKMQSQGDQSNIISGLREEIKKLKVANEEIAAQVAQPVQVPEVKKDTGDQVTILSSEIASLKAENKRLQDSIAAEPHDDQQANNAVESINAELVALKKENEDLKKQAPSAAQQSQEQIDALTKSLETLKQENEALATKLAASGAGVTPTQVQQAELDALKDSNKKLEEQIAAQNAAPEIASAKEALEKMDKENKELKASLLTYQKSQETIDALTKELAALKEKKGTLQDELVSQTKTDATLSTLSEELAALKKENLELKSQAETAAKGKTEIESLNKKLVSLETENSDLKKSVEAAKAEKAAAKTLTTQVETLKSENEGLKLQLAAAEEAGAKAKAVNEEVAELKAKQEESEKQLAAQEKAKADAVAAVEAQMKTLKDENNSLKTEVAKKGEADAKIISLGADVKVLEDENTNLKDKIASAETAGKADLEKLKTENESLKKELTAQGETEAKIISLNAELTALKDENTQLKEKVETAAAAPVAASETAAEIAANAELETLKSENATLKEALKSKESAETKLASLETEMSALKTENEDLKQKLEAKVADVAIPPVGAEIAQAEIDTLKKENADLKAQIETLSAGQQNIEVVDGKASQELLSRIDVLEQEKKQLEEDLDKAKTASAETVVANADSELTDKQKAEIILLKDKLAAQESVQQEYEALQDENASMKVKLGMLSEGEQAIAQMQDRVKDLEQQNEGLRNQLAAQRTQEQTIVAQASNAPVQARMQAVVTEPVMAHKIAKENVQNMVEDLDPRKGKSATALQSVATAAADNPDQHLLPKTQLQANPFEKVLTNAATPTAQQPAPSSQTPQPALEQPLVKAPPPPKEGMTDAQYQEMLLSESLRTKQEPPKPVAQANPQVEKQLEEPIYPSGNAAPIVPGVAPAENIVVQQSAPPEGEIAPVIAPEPAPVSAPVTTAAAPPPPVAQGGYYIPGFNVQDLLAQAHVANSQQVSLVEKASGADKVAYQWQSQGVFGSAEQRPLANGQFEQNVKDYLERTQKRCGGEFAVVPDQSMELGATRVDSYEIACVGNNVNSSATLLFFNKDNTFTVLTHEAPVENMDAAMGFRDRVLEVIKKS